MNPTETPYQRFEATVEKTPEAVALDLGDREVTYADLHRLVVDAATHLSVLGLPRQSRVGLVATTDLSTYVGYLGILRLAHVVVPLGQDNPLSFQETVARLAGLSAAIVSEATHPDLAGTLRAMGVHVVDPADLSAPRSDALKQSLASDPDDVAYILFTSGSTGQPKGVPIRNGNVSSYLDRVVPRYELGPGARLSQTFALTFDPSVFDLFGTWTSGATLVVPRKRELFAPASYVRARQITHWYSVPSLVSYARRIGNLQPNAMPSLRWSKFIGEPLTQDLARLWMSSAPASIVDNVYGPTELTVSCSDHRLPMNIGTWPQTSNGTVPIGEIYPALEWILIDGDRVIEDEGELCVRGPQRFQGYLDETDNCGRFARIAAETVSILGEQDRLLPTDWYRTGDRVRRFGRDLLHLGRIDRQVKIKGYRIELSDVEGAIRSHPAVHDVAVLVAADTHGNLEMRAVVSGDAEAGTAVAAHLRGVIPAYMIPSSVVWLPELPVNRSGKVDYLTLQQIAWAAS